MLTEESTSVNIKETNMMQSLEILAITEGGDVSNI
jgi:hypothetical protein